MRKFVLAIAALLSLPGACYATFAIFQTYAGPPQIFYNIVTDAGAACNGDVQTVTRTATLSTGVGGFKYLGVTVDTFTAGDVGKGIKVPGAGLSNTATIASFTDAQNVVLSSAGSAFGPTSVAITYGTDDAPAFKTFNTWARANQGAANQVVLTIPNGANCWFSGPQSIPGTTIFNAFAAGISNLIVEGAGATLNSINGFGYQLAGQGIIEKGLTDVGGQSARIQSASAGATQITLTPASFSAGYISRFSAGGWIMIGDLNTQANWMSPAGSGSPPNIVNFEWRQMTNVNAGTGVITLDRALTNSYLSTLPEYSNGDSFRPDPGGPATIWALNDTWNTTVEYRGLTFNQSGQIYSQGRYVTYRNVAFIGAGGNCGALPTQNETWTVIGATYDNCILETDKLVGVMEMDGVTIRQIDFQSSSTNLFILRNSTVTSQISGTPTNTDISDSTIALLKFGPTGYGAANGYAKCTRCTVAAIAEGGVVLNRPTDFSMSSGVISFPNTAASSFDPAQLPFVPPNGNVFWGGGGFLTTGLFNVQAMTQDATNTYIQTNEAGTYPAVSGSPVFRTHPAPQFTCDTCNVGSGDQRLYAMSVQRGATPLAPYGSYSSLDYAPTSAQGALQSMLARGKIVSLTVNVTQAYSGAGSATLNVTSQFNNMPTVKQSDWSSFLWGPQINLKQAGSRVITPSSVTCDGVAAPTGCSGDSLGTALPEAVWITDKLDPYMGSTLGVGTQPQFTITIRTDQGVVP